MAGNSTQPGPIEIPTIETSKCDRPSVSDLTWRSICDVFENGRMVGDATIDTMVSGICGRAGHNFLASIRFAYYMANPTAASRVAIKTEIRDAIESGVPLFIPVCQRNHWVLAVVTSRAVNIYDSMTSYSRRYGLHQEIYTYVVEALDPSINLIIMDCDQQRPGSNDCGIFAVVHAAHWAKTATLAPAILGGYVAVHGRQRMGAMLAAILREKENEGDGKRQPATRDRPAATPGPAKDLSILTVPPEPRPGCNRKKGTVYTSTPKKAGVSRGVPSKKASDERPPPSPPSLSTIATAGSTSTGSPCRRPASPTLEELQGLRGDEFRQYAKSGPNSECRFCTNMNRLVPDFKIKNRVSSGKLGTVSARNRHIEQVHKAHLQ